MPKKRLQHISLLPPWLQLWSTSYSFYGVHDGSVIESSGDQSFPAALELTDCETQVALSIPEGRNITSGGGREQT